MTLTLELSDDPTEAGEQIMEAYKAYACAGTPFDAFEACKKYANKRTEHCGAIFIGGNGGVIAAKALFKGSANKCVFGIRETFAEALRLGAIQIILFHNHPSGGLEPSAEDLSLTKAFIEAGKVLQITVNDHLIISKYGYTSLRTTHSFGW